jgi:hypothetical protein
MINATVLIGYFYFENMETMQKVMGPNRDQLCADMPNYTNIQSPWSKLVR